MANLFAKRLCGTFLWSFATFICGTWELVRVEPLCGSLRNLTLYVEPEPLRVEHVCETLGTLELLRVQPLCGTLGNLNLYMEPGNF